MSILKNRKKKAHRFVVSIIALSLIIGSACTLTGCHGSKGSTAFAVPESFDESKPVEIVFWAKNDTNKNQTNVYEKAIRDFQSIYPNITVNMRLYTDYSRIYNDVITNISTNTTPNVCITYPDHIATYITGQEQVVALDELLTNPVYGLGGSQIRYDAPTVDEVIPEFLEECKIGDHYYALPYMRSTEAMYINKDFVEKLGYEIPDVLTWDFVWEVSEKALAKDDAGNYLVNGQSTLIPFIYKSTDNMMISMLKQMGGAYSNEKGEIEIFNDDTADILKTVASHGKSGAFSTFKISSYPANFLNAGQCIFAIDSTAGSTWMGADAPLSDIDESAAIEFETVVRPIPQVNVDQTYMISQGPSVCIFNKDNEQEVLASWLFMQYLLSNEVQIGYAQTEGYVPVTQKARDTDAYKDYLDRGGEDNKEHYSVKIDATKLLLANTANTFVTPVFNGSASLRAAAGDMIEDAVKSVRRKKTIDDAWIEAEYQNMNSLYRLDQMSGTVMSGAGSTDLGPLPVTSIVLLSCIAISWIGIITYFIFIKLKKRG